MTTEEQCRLCGAAVPLARSVLGKMLVPPALSALGIRKGATIGEQILYLGAGLAIGHVVDLAIRGVASSICRECSEANHHPAR